MADSPDDWSKLLQESQALTSHIDTEGAPALVKNIAQLSATSRKLARAHPKDADSRAEPRAQIFLAKQGVDLSKQSATLLKIDLSRAYEAMEPLGDLDLDKYLDHKSQMLVTAAIEESSKLTENSFRNHYLHRLEDDWDRCHTHSTRPNTHPPCTPPDTHERHTHKHTHTHTHTHAHTHTHTHNTHNTHITILKKAVFART